MKLPGPNQTGIADRRPRLMPSERLAMLRPVRRALAAGLQQDPAAEKLGAHDADANYFRLSKDQLVDPAGAGIDVLAYLRGWIERQQTKKREG